MKPPRLGKALVMLLVFALSLALASCGASPVTQTSEAGGKMLVAASIPPIADFVRNVGGEHVRVLLMVPPGASPHTYEPTPAQMKDLARARLLFINGVGLEFWAQNAADAAGSSLQMVVLSEGMEILGKGKHGGGNPHIWLSPVRARKYVERIRDALIAADPAHEADYRANAAAYLKRLAKLDADIRAEVKTFKSREMVTFHASWVYFIHDYGLHQAAVLETTPGKEPSPAELARIVETIKRTHAPAVFAEPQFSPQAAKVIAEEAGVPVLILDPLGGLPPRETYIKLMYWNLQQMKRGLGGKSD